MNTALRLEPRAGEVLGLHQDALPAVLHSPGLVARQPVISRGPSRVARADRLAMERRWREQMLTSLAGRYRMVIGVHALYFLRAHFPDLVREQTGHLLYLIEEDRVTLQVLPTDAHVNSLRQGLIVLRQLPNQADHAYLQQHTTWIAVPDLATPLHAAWQHVHRAALSAEDTRTRLQRMHETGDPHHFQDKEGYPSTVGTRRL